MNQQISYVGTMHLNHILKYKTFEIAFEWVYFTKKKMREDISYRNLPQGDD